MAHFAKLDSDNKVVTVLVVDNDVLIDDNGTESEQRGIEYLANIFGYQKWKQTSYNASFRKNYAGVDYTYNEKMDAFIPPKPYQSWVLNEQLCQWQAPVAYPTDDFSYVWNEETVSWKKADIPSPR
jgi:hypothetical protein